MPCSRVRDAVLQSILAPANSRRRLSHETEPRGIIEWTNWTGGSWGRPPRLAKTTAGLIGQIIVESSAGTRVFLTRAVQPFRTYRTCVSRFATSFGLPQVRDKVAVWKRFGPTVCERQRVAQGSCKCGWRKVQRQGLPQRIGCTFRVPNTVGIPAQKENERAGHQKYGRAVRQSGD